MRPHPTRWESCWLCDVCLRVVQAVVRIRPPVDLQCPECRADLRLLHQIPISQA